MSMPRSTARAEITVEASHEASYSRGALSKGEPWPCFINIFPIEHF